MCPLARSSHWGGSQRIREIIMGTDERVEHMTELLCASDITEEEVEREEFIEGLSARKDLSDEEKMEILEESKYN